MILKRSTLLIGEGRLSSSVLNGSEISFFIDRDGAIERRFLSLARRGVSLDREFSSYACDYARLGDITVEKLLNETEIRR